MHISAKGNYGLRAMLDLSLHSGQGPILSASIAVRQNIPEAYLVQLLNLLRKAGLVRSIRGPKGGHHLLKRPEEITVGEVLAVLEGPIDLLGKGEDTATDTDVFGDVWEAVEMAIKDVLSSVTFAELCKKHHMRRVNITFRI
jgi:Rrf2 family protein